MLEDVGKELKKQDEADKKAKDEADAKAKIELENRLRAEAAGATPDPKVKALEEALRISEEGRRRTEELLRSAGVPRRAEPEPVKEMTREELNELYQKDPLSAIGILLEKSTKTVEENVSRRIEPLIAGGAATAREAARAKYPDEFQLFGADIAKMLEDPRINKSAMNNIQAWDDMISYIRGQPGNFEKLVEHRISKDKDKAAETARAKERESAGAHTRSEVRAPAPSGGGAELDETEREIARALNPGMEPDEAYADYKKWRGVAR